MLKLSVVASPLAVVLALALGSTTFIAGCASDTGDMKPMQQSPDQKAKEPNKTPAGTTSGGTSTGGTSTGGTSPAAMTANPKPQSPDASAKDLTKPTMADMPTMTFKDATHVLKADSPYYASAPATGDKPEGTWKAGTPVLVMVPGAPYSQVKTATGTEAYVPTMNLKSVAK